MREEHQLLEELEYLDNDIKLSVENNKSRLAQKGNNLLTLTIRHE